MTMKAHETFKLLQGVICAYKPPKTSFKYVLYRLKKNICEELNLQERPPRQYLDINRSSSEISINVRTSYADNVLCSGPRYERHDIELNIVNPISELSSGVFVVCINDGENFSRVLKKLNLTRCYHLKGVLGQATTNYHIDNKVLIKANYEKVTRIKFEKILANYQSATQRKLFEEYGLPLKSQEAYSFAVKGLYRPTWKGSPVIYSIKIVNFEPPNFTLEVQCIHETEQHLLHLIHNLGLNLKCFATCTGIRCLRHGCFHVEHALVKNQWNLDEILKNLKMCWTLLEENYPNKIKFSPTVDTIKIPETSMIDNK